MSYQTIIDNASNIKVDNRGMVASTTTRSGYTRTVSRGGQPWIFEVEFPSGPDWREYRRLIAPIADLDRHTSETVKFNAAGHAWMFEYQGDIVGTPQATWTQGQDSFTLSQGAPASGFNFRAGDILQLGASGQVYQVVADAAFSTTTIQVHRPIVEESASNVTILLGQNAGFKVICTSYPRLNLFANNQFGFDGPFTFVETYD